MLHLGRHCKRFFWSWKSGLNDFPAFYEIMAEWVRDWVKQLNFFFFQGLSFVPSRLDLKTTVSVSSLQTLFRAVNTHHKPLWYSGASLVSADPLTGAAASRGPVPRSESLAIIGILAGGALLDHLVLVTQGFSFRRHQPGKFYARAAYSMCSWGKRKALFFLSVSAASLSSKSPLWRVTLCAHTHQSMWEESSQKQPRKRGCHFFGMVVPLVVVCS